MIRSLVGFGLAAPVRQRCTVALETPVKLAMSVPLRFPCLSKLGMYRGDCALAHPFSPAFSYAVISLRRRPSMQVIEIGRRDRVSEPVYMHEPKMRHASDVRR